MIIRVAKARVCAPFTLDLTFNDGTRKRVNLKPILRGPIFRPLRKEEYFRSVKLDSVCGTVFWPNGADIAPEKLHALEPVKPEKTTATKGEKKQSKDRKPRKST